MHSLRPPSRYSDGLKKTLRHKINIRFHLVPLVMHRFRRKWKKIIILFLIKKYFCFVLCSTVHIQDSIEKQFIELWILLRKIWIRGFQNQFLFARGCTAFSMWGILVCELLILFFQIYCWAFLVADRYQEPKKDEYQPHLSAFEDALCTII